jgi:hypothetical protein
MFLEDSQSENTYLVHRSQIVGPTAISYNTFMERLPESVRSDILSHVEYAPEDPNAPGSASEFLNMVRLKRTHCLYFSKYRSDFFVAFGSIESLRGETWCIALEDGKILAPTINVCMRKNGYLIKEPFLNVISDNEYALKKRERQKFAGFDIFLEKVDVI